MTTHRGDEVQDVELASLDPAFVRFDLTEFQTSGLLLMVNEMVLWPLGLALIVIIDKRVEPARVVGMDVRQWKFRDGRRERIESPTDDEATEKRARVLEWIQERINLMPDDLSEIGPAVRLLDRVKRAQKGGGL